MHLYKVACDRMSHSCFVLDHNHRTISGNIYFGNNVDDISLLSTYQGGPGATMSADPSQVSNGYFHGACNFVVTGSHLTEVTVMSLSYVEHANNAKL